MLAKMELPSNGMHKPKAQELQYDWGVLSLKDALASLECMPRPPSIENFTCILHKCRKMKNLAFAQCLYGYMCKNGLDSHKSLGNYLVPMLVEVGSICDAQKVFDRLVVRNEYSWTSLITGYIQCGESKHALNLYQKMQEDCVNPNEYTFVALLKACARQNDPQRGLEVHAEIARIGLEKDPFVGNALVNMYAKCGLFSKAREVFDILAVRDEVSWNALIAGLAEHGFGKEALMYFEKMQLEGLSPNAVTFVCSLKACGNVGAIDKGQEIHAQIARNGLLEKDLVVGSTLVDMYAKCGLPAKARETFDKLFIRNVISWTALIAGYVERGLGEEALNCFKQMQLEGVSPNAVTFVYCLKACGSTVSLDKGQEIHAEITRRGFERHLVVGSTLVDMYAKFGLATKAQEVFDKLTFRNEVSWNALIAGYVEHGLGEKALDCFEQMHLEGISPDAVTFVCSLKACGSLGAIDQGREIHAEVIRKGLLERDLFIGNALVDMYSKCGSLTKAREVFDKLPNRNEALWNALIAGYAKHELGEEALHCFEQMQLEGVSPNTVTLLCILKACGSIGATCKGEEVHAGIARKGLERDIFIGNALVDMYAKCGMLERAQGVFDKLPMRDAVSWNALMTGYATHGLGEKALNCFKQMQLEGIPPDAITFVCSLKACSSIGSIDKGREIHFEISRKGLLERDIFVGNALVDMYAKCGLLAKAREVLYKLPNRNEVSWNALIVGYAIHGLGAEALNCFEQMQVEGFLPNAVTFVCSLKACGSIGAADKGGDLHAEIARKGLHKDLVVGSTLVDMYAKCGLLAKAQDVFDNLPVRNKVSWNALIAGYAYLGESENVFQMFEEMRGEGIKPDEVTFLSVLTVCSHRGLVYEGQKYFEAMSKEYDISLTIEHHTCMIDLFSRAGLLDEAVAMMKKMPFHPNLVAWHSVLGACKKWGNVELGKQAFEHAVRLDEKDAAAYVLMSNIYADAHM